MRYVRAEIRAMSSIILVHRQRHLTGNRYDMRDSQGIERGNFDLFDFSAGFFEALQLRVAGRHDLRIRVAKPGSKIPKVIPRTPSFPPRSRKFRGINGRLILRHRIQLVRAGDSEIRQRQIRYAGGQGADVRHAQLIGAAPCSETRPNVALIP